MIDTMMHFFLFFPFLFGRQVQRLRHLKGAKCEEHHHQRPWGPAMLGTGFHVVSITTPVSQVMESIPECFYIRLYFSPTFTCDEQMPPIRQINR